MTLHHGWEILNSPLAILLFGSGAGFLFVKFAWEPLMARRTAREKQEGFRREVKFRLTNIRLELRKIRWNYESEVNPKSDSPALYIDPTYQFWALHALIYAGWGPKNFEDCYPLVDQLYDASSREAAGEKLDELEKRLTAGRIAL